MPEHIDSEAFDRDRLMVMCAPNGARKSKADHPSLPIRPNELADEAERLVAVGVSVLHLHVRDENGEHSLEIARYREAIAAIRARVGHSLVIQVTTESVGRYSRHQQMDLVLALKPEAVSLALGELCPGVAEEEEAGRFFCALPDQGTWPQFIVYTPDQLVRLDRLRQRRLLGSERPSCLLVLGSYVDAREGSLEELERFLDVLDPRHFSWSACCFGRTEQAVLKHVAQRGGHVRLGFENNHELPDSAVATDNSDLVQAFLSAMGATARALSTAEDVRHNLLEH
jgi:3-keto-5-aminohexanoate cleavage enzyme